MEKYWHKRRIYNEGIDHKKDILNFGSYGILSLRNGPITGEQIESARVALKRVLGKSVHIWIRILPYKPVTKKSNGVRMGKGKGVLDHLIYYAKQDEILFEIDLVPEARAQRAFQISNSKLPIPTLLVKKE